MKIAYMWYYVVTMGLFEFVGKVLWVMIFPLWLPASIFCTIKKRGKHETVRDFIFCWKKIFEFKCKKPRRCRDCGRCKCESYQIQFTVTYLVTYVGFIVCIVNALQKASWETLTASVACIWWISTGIVYIIFLCNHENSKIYTQVKQICFYVLLVTLAVILHYFLLSFKSIFITASFAFSCYVYVAFCKGGKLVQEEISKAKNKEVKKTPTQKAIDQGLVEQNDKSVKEAPKVKIPDSDSRLCDLYLANKGNKKIHNEVLKFFSNVSPEMYHRHLKFLKKTLSVGVDIGNEIFGKESVVFMIGLHNQYVKKNTDAKEIKQLIIEKIAA